MKKLFNLAMILMIAIFTLSCNNTDNPESVKQEVNNDSKSNLAARGEGQEIKDPSNLTLEEQKELTSEAFEAVMYFKNNPEAEQFVTPSGRKAVTLCHDSYNSPRGNACVYNSSGYLVNVTWEPQFISGPSGNSGFYFDDGPRTYTGTIVSQCNC